METRLFSMSGIKRDRNRFREIVRGKIRQNLKKFISSGDLVIKRGSEKVSIPLPHIELPHFIFGDKNQQGVGQGEGSPGDPISGQPGEGEPGEGSAGNNEGEHGLDVEVSLDELAEMLGEELKLPRIQPKGRQLLKAPSKRYRDIRTVGPSALRHFKRTFREALKRQIVAGVYDDKHPVIIPIKADMRYRSWSEVELPQNNAVIVYVMDVSGSMGDEQKEIVRTEAFWIDTWLKSQYKDLQRRYIIHDAVAREVDEDTFYRTRESGGTLISSAYRLAIDILERDYPVEDWNAYVFHFSDGDNWSGEDTSLCMQLLTERLLPTVNQFSYGQVESRYGSGQFFKDLLEKFPDEEKLVATRIEDKNAIYDSIKAFLGTGR